MVSPALVVLLELLRNAAALAAWAAPLLLLGQRFRAPTESLVPARAAAAAGQLATPHHDQRGADDGDRACVHCEQYFRDSGGQSGGRHFEHQYFQHGFIVDSSL